MSDLKVKDWKSQNSIDCPVRVLHMFTLTFVLQITYVAPAGERFFLEDLRGSEAKEEKGDEKKGER